MKERGDKPEDLPYLPNRIKYQKWLDKQTKKDAKLKHKA
jgi:hypothetical protein